MPLSKEEFKQYLTDTYSEGEFDQVFEQNVFKIPVKSLVPNTLFGEDSLRFSTGEGTLKVYFLTNSYKLICHCRSYNDKWILPNETKEIFKNLLPFKIKAKPFQAIDTDELEQLSSYIEVSLKPIFNSCSLNIIDMNWRENNGISVENNQVLNGSANIQLANYRLDLYDTWTYNVAYEIKGTYSIKGFEENLNKIKPFFETSTWQPYVENFKKVMLNISKESLNSPNKFSRTALSYDSVANIGKPLNHMPEKEKEEFGDWLIESCKESLIKCNNNDITPLINDSVFLDKITQVGQFWKAYIYFKEELDIDLFKAFGSNLPKNRILITCGVRGQNEIIIPKEVFLNNKTIQLCNAVEGLEFRIEDGTTSLGNVYFLCVRKAFTLVHIPNSITSLIDLKHFDTCFLVFNTYVDSDGEIHPSSFEVTAVQKKIYFEKTVQEKI